MPRVGVDTISWGWTDGEAVDRFMRLDGVVPPGDDPRPLRILPSAGGAIRLSRRLDGLGQVLAFPGASMLCVEGRARALEQADESDHGLGAPASLRSVQERVTDGLGDLLGARVRAPGGLRRADLAGELQWDRPEDGREFLQLLSALHSPRHKISTVLELGGGGMETVAWKSPKGFQTILRAYDKGVESGTAPAGDRIRLERQARYRSGKRPTIDQWLSRDLGELYTTPIRRWLSNGIVPGEPRQLIRLLTDAAELWPNYWASGCSWASGSGRVHERMWTAVKVENVVGVMAIVEDWGSSWPAWNAKQRQRRMLAVRELGLLLTDRPVRVDVDQAVNELCDMWSAAA